jgi:hypothetical protein
MVDQRRMQTPSGQRREADSLLDAAERDAFVERAYVGDAELHRNVLDGKHSHRGVDAVALARTNAGWKIVSFVYTAEPTGCAPGPLGAPAP